MRADENVLGDFLRARRELADPRDAGVPDYGRRRVAGLRREEVALLAGVSSHYYARLEQGRDRHPSPAVVDAVGRVLQLDDPAHEHLRRLAEPVPARRRRPRRPEKVHPELEQLLGRWTREAAVVTGRHRDVLAANDLAVAVNPGFAPGRNLVRDTFLEPWARKTYVDWEQIAQGAVAGLRGAAGAELDDPHLTDLVGELSLKSEDFRRMWARHDVREVRGGVKRFWQPLVGVLTLDYTTLGVHGADGQTLFLFYARPGSPDDDALALLASLTAGDPAPR